MEASTTMKRDDLGKLTLRLTVGGLLLFHGISKAIHGVGWMTDMLAQAGLPGFMRYGIYVGEVVAPILIVVGLLTRPAALVVAFDLLMAIALVFRDKIFTVKEMGGGWTIELEMFFVLGAIALFCLGPGAFSLSRGKGRWD